MTEEQARAWLGERADAQQLRKIEHFVALLLDGARQQNLISRSTIDCIWARHIVDSAQLVAIASDARGSWLDIGSGAGLPGLVTAILADWTTVLVEPRRLRADFLSHCVRELGLEKRVTVKQCRVENLVLGKAVAIVSARAVAAVPQLFDVAYHFTDRDSIWLLPKGRSAQSELADAKRSWHGVFHVEQSIVDPGSGIIVAHQVAKR